MRLGISQIIRMSVLSALLLPGLTSCVTEDGYCPPSDPDGVYTVHLSISAGSFGTRSAGHEFGVSTKDEDFINVSDRDFAVFILDEKDNFVQRVEPGAVSLEREGSYYKYLINGAFKPEKEIEKIRLMVLANWQGFKKSYNDFENKIKNGGVGNVLEYIYQNAVDFNFDMPLGRDGSASWIPENNQKGIPMFGLSDLVTATNEVYEVGSPIPMLRALAKIEIVDKAPGDGAKIAKVVLTSYNTNGRFIPEVNDGGDVPEEEKVNAGWNVKGTQVTTPSLPEDAKLEEKGLKFEKTSRSVTPHEESTAKDRSVYVAYIPEMDFEKQDLTGDSRPVLEVYVEGNDESYIIHLADYTYNSASGKSEEGDLYLSLLRNHIYRYNILSVGIDMELTIESDPWDLDDDQLWDYEDVNTQFAAGGEFAWKDNEGNTWSNYEEFPVADNDDYERILLIGYSDETAAYGSFTLETTKDNNPAKWTIALIGDDVTKNDHFKIEVKNEDNWVSQGEKGDSYTAAIDGAPVEFRIRATEPNSSTTDYTARVVFTITTFDGRVVNKQLSGKSGALPTEDKYYYQVKQLTNGGDNM